MANEWGRKETIIWPPQVPIYSYAAVAFAMLCTVVLGWRQERFKQGPLQRNYTVAYVKARVGMQFHQHGDYRLVYLAGGRQAPRLALPADVAEGTSVRPDGRVQPIALTDVAKKQGFSYVIAGPERSYADTALARWFRAAIFDNQGLHQLYAVPLVQGGIILFAGLILAVPADTKRFREMKYGRRLRGPEMMTPRQFNRVQQAAMPRVKLTVRANRLWRLYCGKKNEKLLRGIGFKTTEMRRMMRVPLQKESQHFQIMGDTGVGKTQLIMQMLRQIRERGDSAIVYDPACEYVQRFYDEKRGDIVLNPLDARCPYWGPASELGSPAEADAIAASLYQPTTEGRDEFFHQTPAQIFAHLLKQGPEPHELAAWLANADELERRVAGTEMLFYIERKAGPQRAGVLSSLGLVAKCFRLLPSKEETKKTWSARQWAKDRQGWIFITSRPPERETLRPLHSLWIDSLVMRLLTTPQPGQKHVWFVIDELASLQKLPQLHTAITENRKSKNPLVLGFQGKSQLEATYGRLAEVMLSQPATKIYMKTAEPKAAEWISEAIGKVEIERLRETKFDGSRSGKNFQLDRQVESLVMGSEITGLTDRHAYLKLGNHVARFAFRYLDLPARTPGFIPRAGATGELPFDPDTMKPRTGSGTPAPNAPEPLPPDGEKLGPRLVPRPAAQNEAAKASVVTDSLSKPEPVQTVANPVAVARQQQIPQVEEEDDKADEPQANEGFGMDTFGS